MIGRFLKFNVVGMAGVLVQLGALWMLARARMPQVPATFLAVETSLLHNFFWHEIWTWRGASADGRLRRFTRFQVANGTVSIASNVFFTWILTRWLGWPLLVSNLAAIGATGLVNFAIAHYWVFEQRAASER